MELSSDVEEISNSQPISLPSSNGSKRSRTEETQHCDGSSFVEEPQIRKTRPPKHTGQRGDLRSIEEIEEKYRHVFTYPFFNSIQSGVIDDALYSDKSIVVCAPTGSGKTVIFEMAIVQLLMELETKNYVEDFKIIYMAPVKSLCTERLTEWYSKFSKLGVLCIEVTGDTDVDFAQLKPYSIIITTPEKWDMLTRRWRDHRSLVGVVKLFLIDEVHILNDEARGPVIEAVVSRMKTIESSAQSAYRIEQLKRQCEDFSEDFSTRSGPPSIRFVAVSATVNNPEDVAAWLETKEKPAVFYKFGEECRPVKVHRVVEGYHCSNGANVFKFDITLNYKLWPVIQKYSDGKPTLIFCCTRKSVTQTGDALAREITFRFTPEQQASLEAAASGIKNKKIQQLVLNGIGCHHAGLLYEERLRIEQAFRNKILPILITTTTLAMGVNLPAHLVIIKNTQQYVNGTWQEYSASTLLQMVGRAGRPQYDTEATAVIMTRLQEKARYQALVGGKEPLQSFLHKRLAENLNSEAALGTVSDVAQCVQWLHSTFLYVRAAKDPKLYLGLPPNAPQHLISKKIEELCVKSMNRIASLGLISMDEASCIQSTDAGRLMSIYYLDFETMSHIMKINGNETLESLLWLVCESHELSSMPLRVDERRCLNSLNRNNAAATIRYPMKGKINSRQMKLSCMIQAILGCLPIPDPSLNQEAIKIIRTADRVCKCLVAYTTRSDLIQSLPLFFSTVLNSLILAKCIKAQLWENSPYVSKQLKGIGPTFSTLLATAGKVNFMLLEESHPRDLERIMNKGPPAGNVLRKQISLLPKYQLITTPIDGHRVSVQLKLLNQAQMAENMEELTTGANHKCHLVVGDSNNRLLLLTTIKDKDLMTTYDGVVTHEITRTNDFEHKILVHYISTTFVGIDAYCDYTFMNLEPSYTRGESYAYSDISQNTRMNKTNERQTTITDSFKQRKRKNNDEITQSKEKKRRENILIEEFRNLKESFRVTSKIMKDDFNNLPEKPTNSGIDLVDQQNSILQRPVRQYEFDIQDLDEAIFENDHKISDNNDINHLEYPEISLDSDTNTNNVDTSVHLYNNTHELPDYSTIDLTEQPRRTKLYGTRPYEYDIQNLDTYENGQERSEICENNDSEYPEVILDSDEEKNNVDNRVDDILKKIENEIAENYYTGTRKVNFDLATTNNPKIDFKYGHATHASIKSINNSIKSNGSKQIKMRKNISQKPVKSNFNIIEQIKKQTEDISDGKEKNNEGNNEFCKTIKSQIEKFLSQTCNKKMLNAKDLALTFDESEHSLQQNSTNKLISERKINAGNDIPIQDSTIYIGSKDLSKQIFGLTKTLENNARPYSQNYIQFASTEMTEHDKDEIDKNVSTLTDKSIYRSNFKSTDFEIDEILDQIDELSKDEVATEIAKVKESKNKNESTLTDNTTNKKIDDHLTHQDSAINSKNIDSNSKCLLTLSIIEKKNLPKEDECIITAPICNEIIPVVKNQVSSPHSNYDIAPSRMNAATNIIHALPYFQKQASASSLLLHDPLHQSTSVVPASAEPESISNLESSNHLQQLVPYKLNSSNYLSDYCLALDNQTLEIQDADNCRGEHNTEVKKLTTLMLPLLNDNMSSVTSDSDYVLQDQNIDNNSGTSNKNSDKSEYIRRKYTATQIDFSNKETQHQRVQIIKRITLDVDVTEVIEKKNDGREIDPNFDSEVFQYHKKPEVNSMRYQTILDKQHVNKKPYFQSPLNRNIISYKQKELIKDTELSLESRTVKNKTHDENCDKLPNYENTKKARKVSTDYDYKRESHIKTVNTELSLGSTTVKNKTHDENSNFKSPNMDRKVSTEYDCKIVLHNEKINTELSLGSTAIMNKAYDENYCDTLPKYGSPNMDRKISTDYDREREQLHNDKVDIISSKQIVEEARNILEPSNNLEINNTISEEVDMTEQIKEVPISNTKKMSTDIKPQSKTSEIESLLEKYRKIIRKSNKEPTTNIPNDTVLTNKTNFTKSVKDLESLNTASKKKFNNKENLINKQKTYKTNEIKGAKATLSKTLGTAATRTSKPTVVNEVLIPKPEAFRPIITDTEDFRYRDVDYNIEEDCIPPVLTLDLPDVDLDEIDQSMFNPKTLLLCFNNSEIIPPPAEFSDNDHTSISYSPTCNVANPGDKLETGCDHETQESEYLNITEDFDYDKKSFEDYGRDKVSPKDKGMETWVLSREDSEPHYSFENTNPFKSCTVTRNNLSRDNFNNRANFNYSRNAKLGNFKYPTKSKLIL